MPRIGSSPRAWGTLWINIRDAPPSRFIPTCVGNSEGRPPPNKNSFGSSPRAWGTQELLIPLRDEGRFIPTCVGNSCTARYVDVPCAVHPHVRGELRYVARAYDTHYGSSPRAWETPLIEVPLRWEYRFIPTCVGNSRRTLRRRPARTVHPHVRGELHFMHLTILDIVGSSPRAWGTPLQPRFGIFRNRFIPTCVGNSLTRSEGRTPRTVHPHVRGELVWAPPREGRATVHPHVRGELIFGA